MSQGEVLSAPAGGARRGPVAVALGAAAILLSLYLASAILFAHPSVLLDDGAGGFPRVFRFNLVLIVLVALELASLRFDARASARDFAALCAGLDATDERRTRWRARLAGPSRPTATAALVGGALFGIALIALGVALGGARSPGWSGHVVWIYLLNPLQFACLALLAATSLGRARLFDEVGAELSPSLLEREGLEPFARVGLRFAAYWLVGSSIASLLALDASAPLLVYAVVAATGSLGAISLLLPSRGVHRRLRETRRRELAWLRREIARARGALADPAADGSAAARMPALLAYETRVEQASVWPFGVPTLVRFGLFLVLGVGSWLGGALVERLLDSALR